MKNPAIVNELRRLAEVAGDEPLQPAAVVQAARDPNSPLHSQFEWDDSAAAQAYRLWQARALINRVVVNFETTTGTVEHKVFVSLTSDRNEDGGYRVMTDVLSDTELRARLLSDAFAEMETFRKKYARLGELAGVFSAMQAVEEQHASPAA